MNDLIRPSKVAMVLRQFGLSPNKGLGQNFLVDTHALQKIIAAADVKSEDLALEIGPGLGTLTRELALRARQVIAIEKDKKLTPVLAETLSAYSNIKLLFADALHVDFVSLLSAEPPPIKVVANLPYYVTTPLVMGLLESGLTFERLVFLVQKEVADRMGAKPGTDDYGALSLAVQYYAEVTTVAVIPPRAFFPPPKVSSAVVTLKGRACPAESWGLKDEKLLFKLVRAAFGQRRKTLANALVGGGFDKQLVTALLRACQVPENTRGETLSLAAFVALANMMTTLN